jgi:hypothetical protein
MVNDTPSLNGSDMWVESTSRARVPEILLASITALAATGEVEKACRLAGEACVALRSADPAAARRFDVLLHRLTPTLTW